MARSDGYRGPRRSRPRDRRGEGVRPRGGCLRLRGEASHLQGGQGGVRKFGR